MLTPWPMACGNLSPPPKGFEAAQERPGHASVWEDRATGMSEGTRRMTRLLVNLYGLLSARRRRQVVPLLLLILVGAVAEVATLGALLPFLTVLANSGDMNSPPILGGWITNLIGATSPYSIYLFTAAFAASALVAGLLRLALLWKSHRFVEGAVYELSVNLYSRILHEPYISHTKRNSSQVLAALNKVETLGWSVLAPLVTGAGAMIIAAFIVSGLIALDPVVALSAGLGFTGTYLLTTAITRGPLQQSSRVIARALDQRVKAVQEGLGGIRDILLDQSQPTFVKTYEQTMAEYRDARVGVGFFTGSPRFIVEALAMTLIAGISVMVTARPGGLSQALPVLGALALGAQRLLPLVQQVYFGWGSMLGNRQVLVDVIDMMRPSRHGGPESSVEPLPFYQSIELRNVTFGYDDPQRPTIKNVSLTIPKGSRVGIVGKTGSGKSTLMDILLGLLEPDSGDVLIDGVPLRDVNRKAWHKNVAHVPQSIFLADTSLAENIAFGIHPSEIDMELVASSAARARLGDFIDSLPHGFASRVGERGVQLSGGQRQRIGIARALYRQAKVLVLDEATSALDDQTEREVMKSIDDLDGDLTVILIAHRTSTLSNCDMIISLEGDGTAITRSASSEHLTADTRK